MKDKGWIQGSEEDRQGPERDKGQIRGFEKDKGWTQCSVKDKGWIRGSEKDKGWSQGKEDKGLQELGLIREM